MIKLKDIIFVLVGIELYHTLVALLFYGLARNPVDMTYTVMTPEHFGQSVLIHGLITVGLLTYAFWLSKKSELSHHIKNLNKVQ